MLLDIATLVAEETSSSGGRYDIIHSTKDNVAYNPLRSLNQLTLLIHKEIVYTYTVYTYTVYIDHRIHIRRWLPVRYI